MNNGELIDMQSIEYTKDEILMCHDVLCVLANTNLEDLHTGTVELIGVDDQGREGYLEVNFQEYAAKAAAILGSVTAAPAVQGELGVKWAPEEVANGNKGIRWVSDEGVHGRPTDHDCRVYLESNPSARGCRCSECTKLYTTPQPAEQQEGVPEETINAVISLVKDAASAQLNSEFNKYFSKIRGLLTIHRKQGDE